MPMSVTPPHILVTAGPTHEPIDPVRYLANRSSGKQGFAIAAALAARGARVTLVAGPVTLPTPPGVTRIDVETALEMAAAVESVLPVDGAVMVAAVADWRVDSTAQKIKKGPSGPPMLRLVENPDILATLAASPQRPRLLIGFAAETERVTEHATAKLTRKRADWIVANDVSGDVMGGAANAVHIVTANGVESWERLPKDDVAARLAGRILAALAPNAPPTFDTPDSPCYGTAMSGLITIALKRLPHGEGLPLPTYATDGAAGMDVVAAEDSVLAPGARAAIATGFAIAIPEGYEVQVRPRSGLALKHGITCLNTPGTIDSDYRGEVKVILANLGQEPFVIARGDRIAQLVPAPVQRAVLEVVETLDDTARGVGGFGSTGR
jgi:deoxyuridine 5'-triphosphate nucleotidohydrolase